MNNENLVDEINLNVVNSKLYQIVENGNKLLREINNIVYCDFFRNLFINWSSPAMIEFVEKYNKSWIDIKKSFYSTYNAEIKKVVSIINNYGIRKINNIFTLKDESVIYSNLNFVENNGKKGMNIIEVKDIFDDFYSIGLKKIIIILELLEDKIYFYNYKDIVITEFHYLNSDLKNMINNTATSMRDDIDEQISKIKDTINEVSKIWDDGFNV